MIYQVVDISLEYWCIYIYMCIRFWKAWGCTGHYVLNQECLVELVRLERPATQSKSCELAGSKTSAVVKEKV